MKSQSKTWDEKYPDNAFEKINPPQFRTDVISTIEQLHERTQQAKENSKPVEMIGVLTPMPPKALNLGDTTKIDPDGETIDISNLRLEVVGTISDSPSEIQTGAMKDLTVAVSRAATYDQRHLPLWQKAVLLWRFFMELFFDRSYAIYTDPYQDAAYSWWRKQQLKGPLKLRIKAFNKRVLDLFIHRANTERIDTFGIPGFQPSIKR